MNFINKNGIVWDFNESFTLNVNNSHRISNLFIDTIKGCKVWGERYKRYNRYNSEVDLPPPPSSPPGWYIHGAA